MEDGSKGARSKDRLWALNDDCDRSFFLNPPVYDYYYRTSQLHTRLTRKGERRDVYYGRDEPGSDCIQMSGVGMGYMGT
jgi:hypothetical protein